MSTVAAQPSLDGIRKFLDCHRVAIAGVSRQPTDYSRMVMTELRKRGYDVVPVNPAATEIDGLPCLPDPGAATPPVDAVILLVPASKLVEATRTAIDAGVDHLWFRHNEKSGPEYRTAISRARAAGANVIAGECPLMFLPDTQWIHRAHATLRKLTGTFPH